MRNAKQKILFKTMITSDFIYNFIGIIGDIITLWVYFLLHANKVKHDQLMYSTYNLIGSVLILTSLFHHWNLPAAIIEISWIIISGYGIWKCCNR